MYSNNRKHLKYLWQHNSTQYAVPHILSSFVGRVPKRSSNDIQPSRTLYPGCEVLGATCGEGGVTGTKQPALLTYCTDCCLGLGSHQPHICTNEK